MEIVSFVGHGSGSSGHPQGGDEIVVDTVVVAAHDTTGAVYKTGAGVTVGPPPVAGDMVAEAVMIGPPGLAMHVAQRAQPM